jgi:hypothetical protein
MISIVVCSKQKILSENFSENIRKTIGVEYEIIAIDNSENKFSIFEAYNHGWKQSRFDYVCFVHDDVHFNSQNWGENVIRHLQNPETGICGLAGGPLVTHIPASWKNKYQSVNIVQAYQRKNKPERLILLPTDFNELSNEVILLDGVFLCMRRNLDSSLRFDESFSGFHVYDLDICLQAYTAGFKNYVIYDLSLTHFSRGNRDKVYFKNLIMLYKKWETELPLSLEYLNIDKSLQIKEIETKQLFRLFYKLVNRKFSTVETIDEITYFSQQSKLNYFLRSRFVIQIFIYLTKIYLLPVQFFQKTGTENIAKFKIQ